MSNPTIPHTPRIAATVAALLLPLAARAQGTAPTLLPAPSMFAGACTGSTNGGGLGFAGGAPTQENFYTPESSNGNYNSLCNINVVTGSPHSPFSVSSTYPNGGPQVLTARAGVDYGVIRTYAHENIQNWQNDGLFFPRAIGQAGWLDNVTFQSAALNGLPGTISGFLHITGQLDAAGYQGNAAYDVSVLKGPADAPFAATFIANSHQAIGGGQFNQANTLPVDVMLPVTIDFIWGTAFRVGVFNYAVASNTSEGGLNHLPGVATADFEHTVLWTGLTSVTAGGNAVTGYSVTTASGSNWILGPTAEPPTVTPEPATLGLVGAGVLALGAAARRRRLA